MNKGGAPKGNQNASKYRTSLGIPKHMVTNQLVKALKQYEKVDEKDPKKNVKRGQAIRVIMDNVVDAAVKGDRWAVEFVTERVEGKAVNRTETQHEVSGQVEHTGFKVTFEPPKIENVVQGEVLKPLANAPEVLND